LLETAFLSKQDRVVLFNTGSGNKYTDVIAVRLRQEGIAHASA
jgi:threonine synthase